MLKFIKNNPGKDVNSRKGPPQPCRWEIDKKVQVIFDISVLLVTTSSIPNLYLSRGALDAADVAGGLVDMPPDPHLRPFEEENPPVYGMRSCFSSPFSLLFLVVGLGFT